MGGEERGKMSRGSAFSCIVSGHSPWTSGMVRVLHASLRHLNLQGVNCDVAELLGRPVNCFGVTGKSMSLTH